MASKLSNALQNLPNIVKILMVIGVVIFISFLTPNNVKFKYEFEQGQSWRYEDLIAPFDFPIQKTEEEMMSEQANINVDFSPYYYLDPTILKTQKKDFRQAFDEQLESSKRDNQFRDVQRNSGRYLKYGIRFLDNIFNRGIAQILPSHTTKGKDFVVNVVSGNIKKKETLQNLLTVESANELLSDSLPYSRLYEPEFLLPLLTELIEPNLMYNDSLTQKFQNEQLASISSTRGMVKKGDLIIPQNGIVTDDIYQKLVSFRAQYQKKVTDQKSHWGVFLGYFLLAFLIVGTFLAYLQVQATYVYEKFSNLIFMLLWLMVFSYLVYLVELTDNLSSYLIPFCIVPIIVKNFFQERLAIFTHIVVVLIASFLTTLGYEFTFLQILAGIVTVLIYNDMRDWSKFFFTILVIFLTYSVGFLGLNLIKEGDLWNIDWSSYSWFVINAILTLLAYPLIPLLERLFGFTSAITLVELSDLNRPLLKNLSLKAPGTLQHSLQVANLAEAAATEIGANSLLIKVAALYHDIGKTTNPTYYIENQSGRNPHDDLSNFESAKMIISHVTEGVKIAKKNRLPLEIIDIIRSHHGDTRCEYFYRNQLKEFPNQEFDESLFRYPGPRPKTKEETILMCADSLEAASKSLRNPTGQDIDKLVDTIIAGKITNGQFEQSELSFKELDSCILVFKKLLRNINHVRIEYPEE